MYTCTRTLTLEHVKTTLSYCYSYSALDPCPTSAYNNSCPEILDLYTLYMYWAVYMYVFLCVEEKSTYYYSTNLYNATLTHWQCHWQFVYMYGWFSICHSNQIYYYTVLRLDLEVFCSQLVSLTYMYVHVVYNCRFDNHYMYVSFFLSFFPCFFFLFPLSLGIFYSSLFEHTSQSD